MSILCCDTVGWGYRLFPFISISRLTNQRALDGTSTQEISFPSSGLYTIEVKVESVAGKPLGIFIEKARFTVQAE
jgi:hypothetical protein